jgi:glycosyltransferase involved in cell wall biosynthesis
MESQPRQPPPRVVLLDPNSHTLPYDRALAGALARAGCSVELLASPFLYERLPPPDGFRCTEHFFRLTGGRLGRRLAGERRPWPRRALKAGSYPIDWLALLARFLRCPPDVVHVQWSLWPGFDRLVWRLLQRRGVPVVYTAHNLLPHAAAPGDARRYRRLYLAADALIVHTDRSAAELAARFGVPPGRIHVAPHGPLLEEEPALARAAARARLGLPAAAPIVLFAGLIEPYKGLADLVAAFSALAPALPAARLVVAGRPNAPVAAQQAALAAAGLAERARFDLRFLPRAELAAYLCAADVVALPYRAATSSGLLMAARRFGCPVVATTAGDLAVLVEDGVSGLLVPPGDPPALADALRRLLTDPALAARLGMTGQQAALRRQSWLVAAERTLAAYRAVTSRR